MEISKSSYYDWLKGNTHLDTTIKAHMRQHILETFTEHRSRYGARRIAAALRQKGIPVGREQVGRILQQEGLRAIQPRSFVPHTTDSRHNYPISPNLLLEQPSSDRPNKIWVGDITYIPLCVGRWAYLSVWLDLYSRKIVGWQLEDHMQEELVIASMKKALYNRSPPAGLIVHSDRGGQYGGKAFRRLVRNKRKQSMSRADNPYDNAFMESCFSRFKAELLQGGMFESIEDANTEIFEYIEMYYNPGPAAFIAGVQKSGSV